jgi:hypothetical protein
VAYLYEYRETADFDAMIKFLGQSWHLTEGGILIAEAK